MIGKIILGALAYIVPTFPYAYFWHMKIFKKKYDKWQYAGSKPSPPLGLLSMIVQGAALSYGYSMLSAERSSILTGLAYAAFMGVFFWSAHVIAGMAKNEHCRNKGFFFMETIYLAGQFAIFGLLVSLIYAF